MVFEIIAVCVAVLFVILSFILEYHWRSYALHTKMIRIARLFYYGGSLFFFMLLLLVLFGALSGVVRS